MGRPHSPPEPSEGWSSAVSAFSSCSSSLACSVWVRAWISPSGPGVGSGGASAAARRRTRLGPGCSGAPPAARTARAGAPGGASLRWGPPGGCRRVRSGRTTWVLGSGGGVVSSCVGSSGRRTRADADETAVRGACSPKSSFLPSRESSPFLSCSLPLATLSACLLPVFLLIASAELVGALRDLVAVLVDGLGQLLLGLVQESHGCSFDRRDAVPALTDSHHATRQTSPGRTRRSPAPACPSSRWSGPPPRARPTCRSTWPSGSAARWSTPTRCRSTAAWTSAPPSCRSSRAARHPAPPARPARRDRAGDRRGVPGAGPRRSIDDCRGRGVVPVLVGGSALYTRAVLDRLRVPRHRPGGPRAGSRTSSPRSGAARCTRGCAELDPEAAARILPGNGRRVVRALEVIEITGRPFTATLPGRGVRLPGAPCRSASHPAAGARRADRAAGAPDVGRRPRRRGTPARGRRAARGPDGAAGRSATSRCWRSSTGECTEEEALRAHRRRHPAVRPPAGRRGSARTRGSPGSTGTTPTARTGPSPPAARFLDTGERAREDHRDEPGEAHMSSPSSYTVDTPVTVHAPAERVLDRDRRLPPVARLVAVGGPRPGPGASVQRSRRRAGVGLRVVRQPEGRRRPDGDDRGGPGPRVEVALQFLKPFKSRRARRRSRSHPHGDGSTTVTWTMTGPRTTRGPADGAVHQHGQARRQGLREGPGPARDGRGAAPGAPRLAR